jgi:hypothetical protein
MPFDPFTGALVGAGIGLAGNLFGKKSTTTTTKTELPEHIRALMNINDPNAVLPQIYSAVGSAPPVQYYPGQTVQGFTPTQRQGQQMLRNFATSNIPQLFRTGQAGVNRLLNPSGGIGVAPGLRQNLADLMATGGLSAGSPFQSLASGTLSPYYQDVLRGGVGDLARSYQDITTDIGDRARNAIFSSDDSALLTGNFGGSAQGTGRFNVGQEFAKAQGRTDTALQENLQQLYYDVLNQQFDSARAAQLGAFNTVTGARTDALNTAGRIYGLDRGLDLDSINAGLGFIPQLANLGQIPGSIYSQIGAQEQVLGQAQLDANRERFNFNNQIAPYYNVERFANLVAPFTSGGPATTSVTQPVGGSLVGDTLSGGLFGFGAGQLYGGGGGAQFLPGGGTYRPFNSETNTALLNLLASR